MVRDNGKMVQAYRWASLQLDGEGQSAAVSHIVCPPDVKRDACVYVCVCVHVNRVSSERVEKKQRNTASWQSPTTMGREQQLLCHTEEMHMDGSL